jgi:hypothetical protein
MLPKTLPVKSARAGFHSGWDVDRSSVTIGDRGNTDVVGSSPIEFDDADWILQVALSIERFSVILHLLCHPTSRFKY